MRAADGDSADNGSEIVTMGKELNDLQGNKSLKTTC